MPSGWAPSGSEPTTTRSPAGGYAASGEMVATPEDEHVFSSPASASTHDTTDEVTRAQVREAGCFRATLLRELASPEFFSTPDYDVLYRARNIRDAIFVAVHSRGCRVVLTGGIASATRAAAFSPADRDLLAYALRALKWFHRRVMLHHGLLIANAPLTPMGAPSLEPVADRASREGDTHTISTSRPPRLNTYISALFRKFGVSGRAGLTALWLGKSPP